MTTTADFWVAAITAYFCADGCMAVSETEGGPLYECPKCSIRYNREGSANDNHQCPSCKTFGAKVAERSCPQCNEEEVVEVLAVMCQCHDELHVIQEV